MNQFRPSASAQSLVEYALLLLAVFAVVAAFSLTVSGIIFDQYTGLISNISF